MPMDVNEDELVGELSAEVPTLDPTDESCRGKRTEKQGDETIFVGYCKSTPGRGTDHVGEGRCKHHGGNNSGENGQGGAREGAGAEEDNTNGVTHGAYADQSNLYSQEFSDDERALADRIFDDYRERYEAIHDDLPHGHRLRLFKIAVNAVTEIRVENWVNQKPADLESGTTYIDKETKLKTTQEQVYEEIRYKKSPALAAKKTLSNDNRQWLKDLDLLGTDEVDVNVSGDVDHNHEHGLDEDTEQLIESIGDDLKA